MGGAVRSKVEPSLGAEIHDIHVGIGEEIKRVSSQELAGMLPIG